MEAGHGWTTHAEGSARQFVSLVKGSTGRNDTQGRDFCEDIRLFT